MKKLLIALFIVMVITVTTPQRSYAIFVICGNCSTIVQQIPQFVKEAFTAAQTAIVQFNTYQTMYKSVILDPLANGMIAVSLLKQQSSIINLVTGGLGGQSLLQSNPEQWIKNQGLNSVKISIGDVNNSKGVYSASILSSLVGTYKNSNNLTAQIQGLSNSSIPTITQNNLCKDANLTAIAKNDVMHSDGSYTMEDVARRKAEIYNSLCTGNPSTNQTLANKLVQVNSQRPDIGGWDTWLATINGDNAYARSVQTQILVAKDKATKEQQAQDDLNRGGGIASPSNCTARVTSDSEADLKDIANLPCRVRELTNSSANINNAFQEANTAELKRTLSSFGEGILGTIGTLLNTTASLRNAWSAIGVGSGGSNTSTNTNSSSPATQDLANSPDAKSGIVNPSLALINNYSQSIDKLERSDNQLLSALSVAEGAVEGMKTCYQGLVNDFQLDPSDPTVAPGFNYYQSRMSTLAGIRAEVSQDQSGISAARTAISDIKATLQSSNSSEEINVAVEAFQEQTTNGTLPSTTDSAQRESEALQLQGDNQTLNLEGGDIYNLNAQCQSARQQLTPRQGA